jgi:beta-lactam-binding protein with PASTA domain
MKWHKVRIILKNFGLFLLVMAGSFAFGVLIINYVIMPRVVRLGNEAEVPDVCGKSLSEAQSMLNDFYLEGVVSGKKWDDQMPENFVVSQKPLPTRRVKKGKKVFLVISKGKEEVAVPNLLGLSRVEAQNFVTNMGFSIKEIKYVSSNFPANTVVRTDPPFNTYVKKSSEITLFVSSGGGELAMPNLLGKDLWEARDLLQRLGLIVGEIKYTDESYAGSGKVWVQVPKPDKRVTKGDTVNLIIKPFGESE